MTSTLLPIKPKIFTMMLNRYEDIDWSYLEKRAKYELCEDVINSCRKRAETERRAILQEKTIDKTDSEQLDA